MAVVTSVMAIAKALDLSTFADAAAVTDDDFVHIALRMDQPQSVQEIRLYFVCSPFTAGTYDNPAIPGAQPALNTAAYVHTFRPSDYAAYVGNLATAAAAEQAVRATELLGGFGTDISTPHVPGANVWTEFGAIDLPVRRGDFLPIGSAGEPGTDWSTVTGIYIVVVTDAGVPVNVSFDDCYLTGGYSPDNAEPGAQAFDYRVVHYDPRTGARSNGSTTMDEADWVDALRQSVTVTPAAYGDGDMRQELYRRGGSLTENWYFCVRNTADGGALTDIFSDADLINADTLPVDHFQPIATVNSAGTTVLAQPLPVIFGPFDDGTVCGLGDPYRPGYLYACIPGEIDHWPSTGAYAVEVCSPAEELLNGEIIGGAGFVLSRERGYTVHTNLTGGTGIVVTPSGCTPGLAARWGFCKGPGGIFYVAKDGVRVTNGGESAILSDAIRALFHKETVNGYAPIDFSVPAAIRLSVHDNDLYFLYQDTGGTRRCMVFSLVYRYWRPYTFANTVAVAYSDETQSEQDTEGQLQLLLGSTSAKAYTYSGYTDDGTAIAYSLRTGAWHWGHPRVEKRLGDLILEADLNGTTITLQTLLNLERVTNVAQTVTGVAAAGRTRYTFDPFGTTPQHARSLSLNLSGSAPATGQVKLFFAGVAYAVEPEVTMNRPTTWEPLGPSEAYCYACVIDCDTGGVDLTIAVEGDLGGVLVTMATLTVNSSGRHKQWFSWTAVHTQMVRLRPTGECEPWLLYNVEWWHQPEPPRIAGWDSNFETLGDTYYTGLDLECDTFNEAKTVLCYADGVLVKTETVTTNGRLFWHITIPPGRAHVYRFVATDANPGLLYAHKWIVEEEPGEQTHWNAPYTVYNSLSDKYLKGIVIEADTFGEDKTVTVEADGVVVATITPVNHNGRTVKNYTFAQVLGRVFRIIPTDTYPSRLYTAQPLFDEEPFALGRWETQLFDFNLPGSGWGSVLSMDVCYRSTAAVTLTIAVYNAQGTLLQTLTGVDAATSATTLPSTTGAKQKRYMVFSANKGVLFKVIATSADDSGVALYREESRIHLQPWAGEAVLTKLIGNDDLQPTREMVRAALAAARSGGSAR